MLLKFSSAILGLAFAFASTVAPAVTPDIAPASTDGQPTSLALVASITAPKTTTGLLTADELEVLTGANGELSRQLGDLINRPVAIGIDPMILASIRLLGSDAPDSALAWLLRLREASNETFALSYADADIAALSQAGVTPIPAPTAFTVDPELFPEVVEVEPSASGEPTESEPPVTPSASPSPEEPTLPTLESLLSWSYTLEGLAWPREASVVASDLETFNAAGPVTTILSSNNVSYGRDAIPASAVVGENSALVTNTDISALLRAAASAFTEESWQGAITELGLGISGWTGGRSTVVASFDRNGGPTTRVGATIDTLATLPGVQLTTLAAARAEAPVAVGIVDLAVPAERTALLSNMWATEPGLAAFATVLDDPTLLTGERRLALLGLSSNTWVKLSVSWPEQANSYLERSTEILGSIQIVESSEINLLSDKGNLPITISNALPWPVTVNVNVSTETAILDVLEDHVPATIEANSQQRAQVPVESVANGTVTLQLALSSPSGVAITPPSFVTINVHAEWETAFTTTIVVLLAAVFVLGIIRTVRKRRKLRRDSDSIEADDPASAEYIAPAEDAAAAEPGPEPRG